MVGLNRREWHVFTRLERGSDLRYIGSLWASDEITARFYAKNLYDEMKWFEMMIVPKDYQVYVSGPRAI